MWSPEKKKKTHCLELVHHGRQERDHPESLCWSRSLSPPEAGQKVRNRHEPPQTKLRNHSHEAAGHCYVGEQRCFSTSCFKTFMWNSSKCQTNTAQNNNLSGIGTSKKSANSHNALWFVRNVAPWVRMVALFFGIHVKNAI